MGRRRVLGWSVGKQKRQNKNVETASLLWVEISSKGIKKIKQHGSHYKA